MAGNAPLPASKPSLFGWVMLLIWLACLEVGIGVSSLIAPKLFGETRPVLSAIETIDPDRFAKFSSYARGVPAVWGAYEGVGKTKSCLGQEFDVTYDAAGVRVYPGYDARSATVLLIGDSYTAGDEVGDEHTIAAHFHKRTGIVAANMGVGGYSPLQAVLSFEMRVKSFPSAEVVVLGIMYENIRRNVNSYIAVFTGPEGVLGVRPYVQDGTVRLVPGEVFNSLDQFKAYARTALHADFWANPVPAFPYTLTLVEMMRSGSFWLRNKSRAMKLFGRQYSPDYANAELTGALAVVLNRFDESARAANLRPLVIFFPQNRYDLGAPVRWVEEYKASPGNKADVRIMESGQVDWARFNQKPDGSCHASPYGYDMIARAYAKALSEPARGR